MPTYIDLYLAPLITIAVAYFAGVIGFEAAVVLMLLLGLQDSGIVEP